MQQEQKEELAVPNARNNHVSLSESMSVNARPHRRDKTYSSDRSNIRIYSIVTEDRQPTQLAEIRHSVQCLTIVYAVFLSLVIIGAELFLIFEQHQPMVLRYVLIPFGVWIIIGMSSFIFRWQSRKLMMTGYLEFYRKSSRVWKVSYGVCSSAFAIGTTFFIVAQESISPHIHISGIKNNTLMDFLFIFWSMTLMILLLLYINLLVDYVRHNRKRMLPDGVNHNDYRALSEGTSVDNAGWVNEVCDDALRQKSGSSGKHATLSRQAVTIRYLEKQLKQLMNQHLLEQKIRLPTTRSLNDGLLEKNESFSVQDFDQICHEKQLLESECQNLRIQLHSAQQELAGQSRKFRNVWEVREMLEKELEETKDALYAKEAKVNELQILLNVQREAAEQARIFIENLGAHTTNANIQR